MSYPWLMNPQALALATECHGLIAQFSVLLRSLAGLVRQSWVLGAGASGLRQ